MSGSPCLRLRSGSPRALYGGALASAALLALVTTPCGLGWLAYVALVPLLLGVEAAPRPAHGALAGWLLGIGVFGAGLGWVPLAGIGGAGLAVAAGYLAVLAGSLACVTGALAWLRSRDRALWLAAAPLLWIAAEYARSRGSLGYPWQHLGYALVEHPALLSLAALGGVHALSLWIASVSAALVAMRRTPVRALALVALLIGAPPALLGRGHASGELLRVAGVQPNVLEIGRTRDDVFRGNLTRLVALTSSTLPGEPDLIVWPESAYERALGGAADPLLGAIARHHGAPLLVGLWRVAPGAAPALYNSAMLVEGEREPRPAGDKVHPVPFFEAAPRGAIETWLAGAVAWPGGFQRGERSGLVWLERSGAAPLGVGVLICLDSSYPGLASELRRRGASVLVEISNESPTGPWSAVQHAHVSRLRAVESGLPLVRVSNTGPTEWIDPRGQVVHRLAGGLEAAATRALPLPASVPLYVRLGDGPVFIAAMLPPLLLVARRRVRRPIRSRTVLLHEVQS
jgi:apolipoprotein N-acyltransferase